MQGELPQLPLMPSSSAASVPAGALPSPVAAKAAPAMGGGRRLRQIMMVLGGGSVGLVALAGVGELALRPELKPTTILATFEAQTDLKTLNQKLGVKPGEVVLTEADYRAKLAEAERGGQAKAELAYQKNLAVVQADKERIVGAYQTLYQRANIIAQAGVQMEMVATQFRQRLIEQTNGGRSVVISVYDMMCALGDQGSCDSAKEARNMMVGEATVLTEGDLARRVNELMAGIPDPASIAVGEDIERRKASAPEG